MREEKRAKEQKINSNFHTISKQKIMKKKQREKMNKKHYNI